MRARIQGHEGTAMKRFFYDAFYALFALALLPSFRKRTLQDPQPERVWRERMGFWDTFNSQKFRSSVWIHAVSVGEILAAETLIQKLMDEMPEAFFLITTVTPTGQALARKWESPRAHAAYFPFDFTACVKRFFDLARPACLILMETEIWPNVLWEAEQRGVPVIVANARLSEKSFSSYRMWDFFFKPFFKKIALVLAQTPLAALRFQNVGVEHTEVAGNLKFDTANLVPRSEFVSQDIRKKYGFAPLQRIWVAGSTHAPEEHALFEIQKNLGKIFPDLKLFLAPRHSERAPALKKQAQALGLRAALTSERIEAGSHDVLILDEMGALKRIYALAEAVFVGGSWVKHGGQNPLEPAVWAKPIFFGPHVFNFESVYQLLESEGGAKCVKNKAELEQEIKNVLSGSSADSAMGKRALEVVCSQQGATLKHWEHIQKKLNVPVKPKKPKYLSITLGGTA